jgi:hypothetical protein
VREKERLSEQINGNNFPQIISFICPSGVSNGHTNILWRYAFYFYGGFLGTKTKLVTHKSVWPHHGKIDGM